MTERELIERAAISAGRHDLTEWSDNIRDYDSPHRGRPALHTPGVGGECESWNPLEDDGDAFRLMCDLELNVFQAAGKSWAVDPEGWDEISEEGDLRSATRRAIVRAAAAMVEDNQ